MSYSFPTIEQLEREWARVEANRPPPAADVPADILEFAEMVGFTPDPWQEEVLTSDHPNKILCCGRQTGKTTAVGFYVAYKAITVPDSEIVIVAPAERQAKRLFRRAKAYWKRAGEPHGAVSERLTGLELRNGSIIEAVAAVEDTTRGFSPTMLVVDEAAYVPEGTYHQLTGSTVRTEGEEILLSTAGFRTGFFYDTWVSPEDDWLRVQIRSDEMPRHISPQQLERRRRRMPKEFFEADYLCKFLEADAGLFSHDDIEAALLLGEQVEALQIGEDIW